MLPAFVPAEVVVAGRGRRRGRGRRAEARALTYLLYTATLVRRLQKTETVKLDMLVMNDR